MTATGQRAVGYRCAEKGRCFSVSSRSLKLTTGAASRYTEASPTGEPCSRSPRARRAGQTSVTGSPTCPIVVGVIGEVGREQHRFLKIRSVAHAPERRLKRMHDIAAGPDFPA